MLSLQRLAVLVVCHDLAVGQIQIQLQRPMSWFQAREFCQRHYVDLTVLSTEEQYFTLLNATTANKDSFWLGLQRQSTISGWKWVNGEELSYSQWLKENKWHKCYCASLEAMLKEDNKLLARYCEELHMFVCQGPVSPQPVAVDSVGSDHVTLSWNISAFMQMTPHSYNVTTCTSKCDTLVYPYTGSAFMSINLSNLTSAAEYFIEVSAFVRRPDSVTGRDMTLRSKPTSLQVKPASLADSGSQQKVIIVILKWLKFVSLAPPLWILYRILKKCELKSESESDHDVSEVELSAEETIVEVAPRKTRGVG